MLDICNIRPICQMTKPKFIEDLLKIADSLGYCSRQNRLLFLTILMEQGGAVLKTDTQQLIICFRPQKARNTVSPTRYGYKQLCKRRCTRTRLIESGAPMNI